LCVAKSENEMAFSTTKVRVAVMAEMKTKKTKGRVLKRCLLATVFLALVLTLLSYLLLPRIVERVIRGMIVDAGVNRSELRVVKVGWSTAVIENISVGDHGWSMQVERVEVGYDISQLFRGRLEGFRFIGASAEVDLSQPEQEPVAIGSEGGHSDAEVAPEKYWYAMVADTLGLVGEVQAKDVALLVKRNGENWKSQVDMTIGDAGKGHPRVQLVSDDLELSALLVTQQESAEWDFEVVVIEPKRCLDLAGLAIGNDGDILPEGLSLEGAAFNSTLHATKDEISPWRIVGSLNELGYDRGENSGEFFIEAVMIEMRMGSDGMNQADFTGEFSQLSIPRDPLSDLELKLKDGTHPKWAVNVLWSDQKMEFSGELGVIELVGEYDGRPVDFKGVNTEFSMINDRVLGSGTVINDSTKIPLSYHHQMKNTGDGRWSITGGLTAGPVKHTKPLPLLSAFTDLFDDVKLLGTTRSEGNFSVGSHQKFQAKVTTMLEDVEVDVAVGKVKASGVNGSFELNLIPSVADDSDGNNPNYYTLNFSAKKLSIASKDAVDFDLTHRADLAFTIFGKGYLGMDENRLSGEVKNLTLHGEKGDDHLDLELRELLYEMRGDRLETDGIIVSGGNEIPFMYQHLRKDNEAGWELEGFIQVKDAELKEPVDNAVMFVDAMEGNTLSGKVSMKMDFSLGSDKEFDGVLAASIIGGGLSMADDGPVLEGLKGDVLFSSMKTMDTKVFHRVTATKLKAFDIEIEDLGLDYQLLPNGDIRLQNIAMGALGGEVRLDNFTLPGGDEDYQFKMRAKKLDIAQLAKLFPDFEGSISGQIDGFLPLESVEGEIGPGLGEMSLTPSSKAKLRYNAGTKFSSGIDPKTKEYKKMKLVEDSLRNLDLKVLSIRLFDPSDKDKAVVLKLQGQAPSIQGSPPIHLNINGFQPDDDTVDFFDLLLRHRDRLDFGL
jgi:hypothetical protein